MHGQARGVEEPKQLLALLLGTGPGQGVGPLEVSGGSDAVARQKRSGLIWVAVLGGGVRRAGQVEVQDGLVDEVRQPGGGDPGPKHEVDDVERLCTGRGSAVTTRLPGTVNFPRPWSGRTAPGVELPVRPCHPGTE